MSVGNEWLETMEPTIEVGPLRLLVDQRRLIGPRGEVTLRGNAYAVAFRLMRRPGVIVMRSDLISAMYPDPDDEPNDAEGVLRQVILTLREAINLIVGRTPVAIMTEGSVGHWIGLCQWVSRERGSVWSLDREGGA